MWPAKTLIRLSGCPGLSEFAGCQVHCLFCDALAHIRNLLTKLLIFIVNQMGILKFLYHVLFVN